MRAQCVIYFGPTQTTDVGGVFHLVGLDTRLDRTFLRRSIIIMG